MTFFFSFFASFLFLLFIFRNATGRIFTLIFFSSFAKIQLLEKSFLENISLLLFFFFMKKKKKPETFESLFTSHIFHLVFLSPSYLRHLLYFMFRCRSFVCRLYGVHFYEMWQVIFVYYLLLCMAFRRRITAVAMFPTTMNLACCQFKVYTNTYVAFFLRVCFGWALSINL